MKKILFILTIYRNACAHDERFYNLKALKNDLFSIVIICKLILKEDPFSKLIDLVKSEIDILSGRLKTINIKEVLEEMGFPLNWYDVNKL